MEVPTRGRRQALCNHLGVCLHLGQQPCLSHPCVLAPGTMYAAQSDTPKLPRGSRREGWRESRGGTPGCRVGRGPFADMETTTPDSGRGRFQGQGLWGRTPEHPVPRGSVAGERSSPEILEINSPSRAGKALHTFRDEQPYRTLQGQNYRHLSPPLSPGPPPTAPEGGGPWAGLGWVRGLPLCLVQAPFLIHRPEIASGAWHPTGR